MTVIRPRTSLLVVTALLAAWSAWGQAGSVLLNLGPVTDRTPPSGPGINNGPISPFPGQWSAQNVPREFKLSDYQVNLLNDATVFGLPKPVDGIVLTRVINQVTPIGGMIPPSTFNEKTEVLLVTEDLGLFGPGATVSDWDQSFPLGAGAVVKFDTSSSYYRGGGPFGGLGGMVVSASGYDAVIQSFTLVQVPEPSTVALAVMGLAVLGWAARRQAGPR